MSSDDITATTPFGVAGHYSVGTRVGGRYEVLRLLGEGAMGTVYCVRDHELDEVIALKTLRLELAQAAEALVRFRREVKLARRVTHPNVARTYDLGHHEGLRFLTMEYVEGHSLTEHARSRLPIVEVLRIAEEICRGLVAAHAAGVIHRDLKPDNVMLTDSRVVLTDFGIARLDAPDDIHMTQGRIVGTPAYMAPEQVDGRPVDGRTDVYALGAMLFELFTRQIPHDGATPLAVAAAKLMKPAPDPRSIVPDLPEGVAAVIGRMLSRDKEDRPDSAQVLATLERLRGGGGGSVDLTATHVSAAPSLYRRTADTFATSLMRRVGLAPFEADPSVETLARDLERAILDSGARLAMEIDRATTSSNGRDAWTLTGEVRISGTRLRARLRLLPPGSEAPTWTDRIEGSVDDAFAFEDAVVASVARSADATRLSSVELIPDELRDQYTEARAAFLRYGVDETERAVKLCEAMELERPDDPVVWSLHAAALARAWQQRGSVDDAMIIRAEELALRALDKSPNLPDAYMAVSKVRVVRGDYIASVRAAEEALRRAPLHAEAHVMIGDAIGQAGEIHEGLHRIDLGLRLNPMLAHGYIERGRFLALLGKNDEAIAAVRKAIDFGSHAGIPLLNRFSVWWDDRAMAGELADEIERRRSGIAWEAAIPMLRALAEGKMLPNAEPTFDYLLEKARGPGLRNVLRQITAEYFGRFAVDEPVLKQIALLGDSGFIDLSWLDKCPPLAGVRGSPIFAEARSKVAARAAEILKI